MKRIKTTKRKAPRRFDPKSHAFSIRVFRLDSPGRGKNWRPGRGEPMLRGDRFHTEVGLRTLAECQTICRDYNRQAAKEQRQDRAFIGVDWQMLEGERLAIKATAIWNRIVKDGERDSSCCVMANHWGPGVTFFADQMQRLEVVDTSGLTAADVLEQCWAKNEAFYHQLRRRLAEYRSPRKPVLRIARGKAGAA